VQPLHSHHSPDQIIDHPLLLLLALIFLAALMLIASAAM
jgi:hypothetical protein